MPTITEKNLYLQIKDKKIELKVVGIGENGYQKKNEAQLEVFGQEITITVDQE